MTEGTGQTTLEMVNGLAEIAEFMEDEELTTALSMIAKLIIKPDIPAPVAMRLLDFRQLRGSWH
jgi:hypothetical protein